MSSKKPRIGFVGLGFMGHGIAKNILQAGFPLSVVAHRNRAPIDSLVAMGASEVGDLAALAAASDIVHICAPGSPQVESIVTALLPTLQSGSAIVDCSTSDPVSTAKLAELAAAQGVDIVDAPLAGTPQQAEAGELGAMVGADDQVFARVEPVLASWAKQIVHIGKVGDGHRMKLLNNFLAMGYGALFAEALTLGQKVGISPETFDSVIRGGRMDSGFYQTFMGCVIEGNRESHKFTLTNAAKDMRYLESMADSVGLSNPVGNAVKNTYALAVANGGDGPADYVPHLVEFVGKLNGVDQGDT
ncbi:MAG: NAD(P)-dependent oxidoreductase [Pseudomonadota bacterium]